MNALDSSITQFGNTYSARREFSENTTGIHKVAFVCDYLPRQCGIATFSHDLCTAIARTRSVRQTFVVPVNDREEGYDYPPEVRFEIDEQELTAYQRAADFLNINDVDVVCVQHEFGIYGGASGSHLLALLRELKMPVVTTLHTILRDPNPEQRRVMAEILSLSTRVVTMTERGVDFLRDIYKAPLEKIDLIAHGIPDMPFVDPTFYKDKFGVEGKLVLLTFGLLSPNKGIEMVIKALPAVVAEHPNLVYIVLGATHPNLVRDQGEAYRISLEHLAKDLGVDKNIVFYNRFVDLEDLKEFIGAADIYITPYLNEAQITSGTLAYSFGCGKAVVSTPYWHAQELLADGRGVLVPFGDSDAISREILSLMRDETRRHAMRKSAYLAGREMTWSNVAQMYVNTFARARREKSQATRRQFQVKTLDKQLSQLPVIKLDHLFRMTDSTGMFQHAIYTVPNFAEGYCTDDNARGLLLTVMLEDLGDESVRLRAVASSYAAFLSYAFDPESKRFRNFMSFDRRWLESHGSEDSHARAIWALGACVGMSQRRSFQILAGQLFELALGPVMDFQSPRALAFALVGIHCYLRRLSGDRLVNQIRDALTGRLVELYHKVANPNWEWFETVLSYDNAKLAHALILSGRWTSNTDALEIGLKTLRWLTEVQTSPSGYFRPIGSNGFYNRGEIRAEFDQQPLEAHATVSACLEAYRVTHEIYWFDKARAAFEWFQGRNDLGLALYDAQTGGCRDALHVDRVNQNQGAESTLAFLLSLTEMQAMQDTLTAFSTPTVESQAATAARE